MRRFLRADRPKQQSTHPSTSAQASPQFTSPEAYLHGNYEAPRPQIAPRQLFDEDAEVDLPPARDAAPARVTPDERFATSRGSAPPPRDERFATSRGVASQPPMAVVATPPSSPVRPNGTVMARSPSAVEGYALY